MKIENGDHNDLYKNHKSKIFKKIREFLNYVSNINFNEFSKIDSDFYKKLHPSRDTKNNEDDQLNNIIIKELVEDNFNQDGPMTEKNYADNLDELKSDDIALKIKNFSINKKYSDNIL